MKWLYIIAFLVGFSIGLFMYEYGIDIINKIL